MSLREWQEAPAARLLEILRSGANAVDLSDCGCGKTYVACSVIKALDPIPALVVCPKISVTTWQRTLALFNTSASVIGYEKLRTGGTPFGQWQNRIPAPTIFKCEHCQCIIDDKSPRCYAIPSGVHCIALKKGRKKRGQFVFVPQIAFAIFDEIHKCSGLKSDNAELLIAARRQGKKILGLSATLATSPLQMRAAGYALGLFDNVNTGFFSWSRKHGCGRIPNLPGIHWLPGAARRAEIMANINAEILPDKGVRLTTSAIPNFPKRQIRAELFDLEKDYEIEKIYQQMASALAALAKRAAQDASGESPLTQILRLRQRAELLIIPVLVELAEDALAQGKSVAIFVNFTATLDVLRERLRCDCFVSGSPEGVSERENNIRRFQANENRIILLNSAAGGVAISLQDLHGVPRVCLVSPGYSATEFLQICGRTHRDGAKSPAVYRVVLTATPTGQKIKKALDAKLANLTALNDGDLYPI